MCDLVAYKHKGGNGAGNVTLAGQIKEGEPSSTVSYGGITGVMAEELRVFFCQRIGSYDCPLT